MYSPSDVINDERLAGILRCRVEDFPILFAKKLPIGESLDYFDLVREKKIPKRNRKLGYRIVYKIDFTVIASPIKAFKFYLNSHYTPLDCVHGFLNGRNIVTNATPHISQRNVLNIDRENFFESISSETVAKAFESLGFISAIAKKLADISTYEGRLVAGFPTSPIIANIVCVDLDQAMMDFCGKRNLTYTRYADDISISGDKVDVLKDVEAIINTFDFKLNDRKTRNYKKGQSQYVTGLTVSDFLQPRIPRRFKDGLRQKLYYMNKYGISSHIDRIYKCENESELHDFCNQELNRIKGWIDFINGIEPKVAQKYYSIYNNINAVYQKEIEKYVKEYIEKNSVNGVIRLKLPVLSED